MTGDCVGVDIAKAGRLLQQKPAFGGNIVSVIMGSTTPQLATVRPRMYEPLDPREGAEVEVKELKLGTTAAPRMRLVERRTGGGGIALDEADVVLCGGGGVDLSAFERDAIAIGGSARSSAPRQRKIGLLGRPVAPLLYVGVGVEDEPEHWAGAVKSRVIVSVGKDAPAEADVSVSGDFREILPTLLDSTPAAR
jgi:electron transfer flavoprotein alpha subunit